MANKEWLEAWRAEYNKYLNSPEWQAKREAVFAWKGRVCTAQMNGCTGVATSVHHTGEGYKMALDTPLFHLEPVCWPCHMQIEKAKRTAKQRRSDLQDVWRERQKQKPPSPAAVKCEANAE